MRATVIVVFLALALAAFARDMLPSLGSSLLAAAAGIVMNALAARQVRRWERIPSMLAWTAVGDALLITYVVVTTGDTASPFLFLYVLLLKTRTRLEQQRAHLDSLYLAHDE